MIEWNYSGKIGSNIFIEFQKTYSVNPLRNAAHKEEDIWADMKMLTYTIVVVQHITRLI
jgi:hypothetical protein